MKHKKKREYLKVRRKSHEDTLKSLSGNKRVNGYHKPGKYSQKETV